jgi:ParB-like chromosome segregation protein Spo0J
MNAHPLSEIFPAMDADELRVLANDIKAYGLREPVVVLDGQILDGRSRHAACELAGVEPETADYRGGTTPAELLAYVVGKNLHRRHLDTSQRALVAAKLVSTAHGGDRKSDQAANLPLDNAAGINGISQAQAAQALKVSERAVRDAKLVLDAAPKEEVREVERGEMAVSRAAREVRKKKKKRPARPNEVDGGKEFVRTVETLCHDMDRIAARIRSLKGSRFSYSMGWEPAAAQVEAARKTLWQGRPTHDCPYCDGAGCQPCHQTGRVKGSTYHSGKEAKEDSP